MGADGHWSTCEGRAALHPQRRAVLQIAERVGKVVKVDYLIISLEKTLSFLRESESSLYSSLTVEEVIRELEEHLDKWKKSQVGDIERLRFLFGPTGSIQEISIDNGWGKEFLEIAEVVDL